MMKILHVIDSLNGAGPSRSLLAVAKYAAEQGLQQQHRIITLRPEAYPLALFQAKRAGVGVLKVPDNETMLNEIEQADIVQIHFWNSPTMYEFLRRELPAMRLLTWFMILGDHPPQTITPELIDYSDFVIATTPLTFDLPVFQSRSELMENQRASVVYGIADWTRLENLQPRAHENFNVGYIGTVNFNKMHPNYIPMCSGISIPDIKFIVCGGGIEEELQQQAATLGAAAKFDFQGYVENIKPVLEILDVFGYPLYEDTSASSEISLQEAMYAGIPPVVFPYAGCKDLVKNEETGLVVNTETEYQEAIEYLYHHLDFRLELGRNAAEYARRAFDSKKAVQQMHRVYERMIKFPKRQREWDHSRISHLKLSPAAHFVQALGNSSPKFFESMNAADSEVLLEVDAKIAGLSRFMVKGEGGINQYRNHYPDDPYLRLWSGLVLQKKKKHEVAIQEFDAALQLGLTHWRVHWYIAQSAFQTEDLSTAETALKHVLESEPTFHKAQDLLAELSDS